MSAYKKLKNKENINWVNFYVNTKEKNINYERVSSLKKISSNFVYEYILRCLKVLEDDKENISKKTYDYVSETLKWSDVAKVGTKSDRLSWRKKGYDLFVHNIGSASIYKEENKDYNEVVRVLIKTHGLIGQYIKGEVNLDKNKELYELIENNLIAKEELKEILLELNKCVITGVSTSLYKNVEKEVRECINLIINNNFTSVIDLKDKMTRLNNNHVLKEDLKLLEDKRILEPLSNLFKNLELWYFGAALGDFNLKEQIKILLIINNYINKNTKQVTFEKVMKTIYIDYKDKKQVNLYKKRIIEKILSEIQIEDILDKKIKPNPHVSYKITKKNNTLIFDFKFSLETRKLIEFCEVAYTSNIAYNKAVYILYDLLGFRKDKYDRFYNEIDYLATMNASISNKKVLLNYIVGKNVLDVGPGGGALMDMIEEANSNYNVYGIDISSNVIESLNEKKVKEKRNWTLIKGDALYLEEYFSSGSIDTIIYSAIIHELFSYIEYNGRKFNIDTVIKTLKSAYKIIPVGGRIIIRDGIMTEPKNQYRIIEFKNKEDVNILNNYCHDFEGRKVTYKKVGDNKYKMLVNDAMEFLYTYTWGENSYSLEVKEQFGYLTPSEYLNLIKDNLPNSKIIECKAFLQDGYEENLLNKITIYDENMDIVKLPNSTCIIVIEKE